MGHSMVILRGSKINYVDIFVCVVKGDKHKFDVVVASVVSIIVVEKNLIYKLIKSKLNGKYFN